MTKADIKQKGGGGGGAEGVTVPEETCTDAGMLLSVTQKVLKQENQGYRLKQSLFVSNQLLRHCGSFTQCWVKR